MKSRYVIYDTPDRLRVLQEEYTMLGRYSVLGPESLTVFAITPPAVKKEEDEKRRTKYSKRERNYG